MKNGKEHLEAILQRNPDLLLEGTDTRDKPERSLLPGVFTLIGRALVKDAKRVYLTSHTPTDVNKTSYRLWIEKPYMHGGVTHPPWSSDAVAEMWMKRGLNTDNEVYARIARDVSSSSKSEFAALSHSVLENGNQLYDGWAGITYIQVEKDYIPMPEVQVFSNKNHFCWETRLYTIKE